MKQPKKRWASKPRHHPLAQFKSYWMSPPCAWHYLRQHWGSHRMSEARGLRAVLADPDSDYAFPYHHRHGLAWTWC
jgi:hypothetical protein